ncbi:heavy metal translocating P-type ATPase [Fervidibacillus halotolerans]|uniref:Cd(2+)-exporting ATPase n=1 Tax=Fervidibacillus halotolerans TaxID=2980027 RepID=A0A9E8M1V5_9BACI|nr:heavy metal translocating P-type ATPase [Fervidibacillus halotolerans]WAA12744.1 heavy metal translocating P-type ATPase [Fervidibacillus halotolerans]
MKEYKVKGLSCANCAREMEEAIQKLEKGENAKLLFNSSKLLVDPSINMEKVEKILATDGASIEYEKTNGFNNRLMHKEKKGLSLFLDEGALLKLYIGIATVLFLIAIVFEGKWDDRWIVSIYLVSTALSGYKTFMKGLNNLRSLKFNIDTLMTIALIGAFGIGEWKEGTLVAILFGVNEYLEGLGMEKARRSMEELLKIAPKQATVIENEKTFVIPVQSLKKGQIVLVRSGEQIPSDGIIIEGTSSVNEAAITGESLPVEKEMGDSVYGGSINNEGLLKIEITKAYEDSSLAKILHLVEEAQETKTPMELFINRFAKYYTPLIMVISLLVMTVPPLLFGGDWKAWFYQGLAVLIIGCPCSLILASPIAIISGITRNARHGILVKGGVFLEQLGKIDTIAFDKTGTLTKGKPYVEKIVSYDDDFLFVAGSLEKSSSHPIAKAIVEKVEQLGVRFPSPDELTTLSGQGIKGIVNGKEYWAGNEKNLSHITIPEKVQRDINALKETGYTIVIVADRSKILGVFGIADQIREESKEVIAKLHRTGLKHTIMLTGDHEKTAEKVAKQLGVTDFYGNLMPDEKLQLIQKLKKENRVAMVGDGINDAPALAAADLGIAMGKGTDSAIETADIVLMQDHLGKLPDAIKLSKRVNKTIVFNITLALGLKLIALLLAIPGWLTLWIAILSDMGATIIVTLISLTILIEKNKGKGNLQY